MYHALCSKESRQQFGSKIDANIYLWGIDSIRSRHRALSTMGRTVSLTEI